MQKRKNNEARPKFSGSYKKKRVVYFEPSISIPIPSTFFNFFSIKDSLKANLEFKLQSIASYVKTDDDQSSAPLTSCL